MKEAQTINQDPTKKNQAVQADEHKNIQKESTNLTDLLGRVRHNAVVRGYCYQRRRAPRSPGVGVGHSLLPGNPESILDKVAWDTHWENVQPVDSMADGAWAVVGASPVGRMGLVMWTEHIEH